MSVLQHRPSDERPSEVERPRACQTLVWRPLAGGTGFLATNPGTGLRLRLGRQGRRLCALLDGTRTLDQAADDLTTQSGATVTRLDVSRFVDRLAAVGALDRVAHRRPRLRASLLVVLNADAFCGRLAGCVGWFLRPVVQVPVLVAMAASVAVVSGRLDATWITAVSSLAPRQWAVVLAVMGVSVTAHELAHAVMLKHVGLSVSRIGILSVRPLSLAFVDVAGIYDLPRLWDRLRVLLGGAYVHLLVATVAFWVTSAVLSPAAAVGRAIVALEYFLALSSLWPLAKTDGYYALAAVMSRPNLAAVADRLLRVMLWGPAGERAFERRHRPAGEVVALVTFAVLRRMWQVGLVAALAVIAWCGYTSGGGVMVRTVIGVSLLVAALYALHRLARLRREPMGHAGRG